MGEILEDLYYGRIRPNEMGRKAEEATIRELDAAQAELLELVGGQGEEASQKVLRAVDALGHASEAAKFAVGFRLGARLMLAVLYEPGQNMK